jgi:hypothetical protein
VLIVATLPLSIAAYLRFYHYKKEMEAYEELSETGSRMIEKLAEKSME